MKLLGDRRCERVLHVVERCGDNSDSVLSDGRPLAHLQHVPVSHPNSEIIYLYYLNYPPPLSRTRQVSGNTSGNDNDWPPPAISLQGSQ